MTRLSKKATAEMSAEPEADLMEHIGSLSLPGLHLESYTESAFLSKTKPLMSDIERLWPHFAAISQQEGVFSHLGIELQKHTLEVELHWIGNAAIQALNREYRKQDKATDVLTFSMLADAPDPTPWLQLPMLSLGSIFVSVEYAEAALKEEPASAVSISVEQYLLERFIHGMLHLLGQHHDTMEAYHRVVSIQQRTLEALRTV